MILLDANEFWQRVDKSSGPTECWPFLGSVSHHFGYGRVFKNSQFEYAHRHAWLLVNGDTPPEMCVLHRCDNPPCCNPDHLFLGSKTENNLDMFLKGRVRGVSGKTKGEHHWNCRLSDEEVNTIRELCAEGIAQQQVADLFSITGSYVSMLLKHRRRVVSTSAIADDNGKTL